MSEPSTGILGRISGKLLSADLVRNGYDLTFSNTGGPDDNVLFLQVTDLFVGVNTDSPAFQLDVDGTSNALQSINQQATIGNIIFQPSDTVITTVGEINVRPGGIDPVAIFDRLQAGNIQIDGNVIENLSANQNLVLDASGTGAVKLLNPTNFAGDVDVNGSIAMTGNLETTSNITIGDNPNDVVIINTELDQDINPSSDLSFDLGRSDRRWQNAYIPDWTKITTIRPQSAFVGNTMFLGGSNNIQATLGDDDLVFDADSDIYEIEDIRFQDSEITNLLNTPLQLAATGIGYYNFQGDNAMVLPAGTVAERPLFPEVGDTRWNTELGYIECFDGNVYIVSIGPGDQLTQSTAEELNIIYSLLLG